jgi:hypothetical protein
MTPSPHSFTVAALAVLSVSALGSATAQAATLVEPLTAATPVAAYHGTAMWSRLDAATGKYQLVQAIDGDAATLVAVPQREGAFDIDLGTNRAGSTYAVYSRRGDLFRLNPRTAIETKLTKLSSPDQVERSPTIRRGRIAFVRRAGGRDQLRIGDTTTGSKATRLLLQRKAIDSIALGVRQVSWVDGVTKGLPSSRYRVHIHNIATAKDQIVYEAGGGGASFTTVTKPAFTADESGVLWAVARKGAPGSRIVKYTLRTSKLSYAQGSPSYASMALVSDALGAIISTNSAGDPNAGTTDCNADGCSIHYTGPLSFNLKP